MATAPIPEPELNPAEWSEELGLTGQDGSQGSGVSPPTTAAPPDDPGAGSCLNWLFVDLNSYFASVEQEVRPDLRGRPVGVVPMMADTTVCIAASYEAKAFGVKTGTVVADAKSLCPEIVLVEAPPRDLHRLPPSRGRSRGELPARDVLCFQSMRWPAA